MSTEGIASSFTTDHRNCDTLWGEFEGAADVTPDKAAELFAIFQAETEKHFVREEDELFPAFEEATGMTSGPTAVMRTEHEQMRGLMKTIAQAIADGRLEDALDQGDTLLMLTQQHNQKEETILYPMADRTLGPEWVKAS